VGVWQEKSAHLGSGKNRGALLWSAHVGVWVRCFFAVERDVGSMGLLRGKKLKQQSVMCVCRDACACARV